jgi:hypothetical protein
MNVLSIILAIVISFLALSFIYWLWGFIGGLLQTATLGAGYGIGRLLGFKPRSAQQMNALVGVNMILQIGVEWGLIIWAIFNIFSWWFTANWIEKVKLVSGGIWFFSLILDLLILFIVGIIYGKIDQLIKKEEMYSSERMSESLPPAESRHCPKCGKSLSKEANFCRYCGYKLINIS